jgi:hypothetical protein
MHDKSTNGHQITMLHAPNHAPSRLAAARCNALTMQTLGCRTLPWGCQLSGTACAFTACDSQSMPILRTLSQPAPWQSLFVCCVCLVVCVFMMRVVILLRLRCLYVAIAGCAPWLPLCYLFPIVTHHHYYSKYFIFYYIHSEGTRISWVPTNEYSRA